MPELIFALTDGAGTQEGFSANCRLVNGVTEESVLLRYSQSVPIKVNSQNVIYISAHLGIGYY
jgi:hypothetical protein